jgi:hypothetical protein
LPRTPLEYAGVEDGEAGLVDAFEEAETVVEPDSSSRASRVHEGL